MPLTLTLTERPLPLTLTLTEQPLPLTFTLTERPLLPLHPPCSSGFDVHYWAEHRIARNATVLLKASLEEIVQEIVQEIETRRAPSICPRVWA